MKRMFAPLMTYLSEATGYQFRLPVTQDYGALLDEMSSGIIDVGTFNPYGYVPTRKNQGVEILVRHTAHGGSVAWMQRRAGSR